MATGYVKLWRKIEENKELWLNDRAYACFTKLFILASRNTGIYESGLRLLSKRLGNWSINTTKKALKDLENLGCINIKATEIGSEITLIKYMDYQKKSVSKIDTPLSQKLIHPEAKGVSKNDTGVYQKMIRSVSKIDTPKSPLYNKVPAIIVNEEKLLEKLKYKETIYSPADAKRDLQNLQKDFEVWWEKYPKKESKAKAWAIWQKKKPNLEMMLKALEWYVACDRVSDGYILQPTTYLNQERWLDDPSGYSKGGMQNGTNFDKKSEPGKYAGIGRKI